jgi:hypothetical protein
MADVGERTCGEALVSAVLGPEGRSDVARREAALQVGSSFEGDALARALVGPDPVAALVDKVATSAWSIADEDVDAARAAGASDDELFDLIVAAAVGAGTAREAR